MKKKVIGLSCALFAVTVVSILLGFLAGYNHLTIRPFLSSLSAEHPAAATSIRENPNVLFEDDAPPIADGSLPFSKTPAIPDAETAAAIAEAICTAYFKPSSSPQPEFPKIFALNPPNTFRNTEEEPYYTTIVLYDRLPAYWHVHLLPKDRVQRKLNDPVDPYIILGTSCEIVLRASDGKVMICLRYA